MRKIRIYTRTGDKGKTGLFGGRRVAKDDLRVECYGTVDELSSFLGLALACIGHEELARTLSRLQDELFMLGADLATPVTDGEKLSIPRITPAEIAALERSIDHFETSLPPIRNFIFPGGNEQAARLHVCRAVCRRAERLVVKLMAVETINTIDVTYLNRLSDLLFVLARFANVIGHSPETVWKH